LQRLRGRDHRLVEPNVLRDAARKESAVVSGGCGSNEPASHMIIGQRLPRS
jgi:hypothetical protein